MKVIVLNAKNVDPMYVKDVQDFVKSQGHNVHTWEQGTRYNMFDAVLLILNEDQDEILNEAQYDRETKITALDVATVEVGRGLYDAYIDTVKTCFVVIGNSDSGFKMVPVVDSEMYPGNDYRCWGELLVCVHPWFVFDKISDLPLFKNAKILPQSKTLSNDVGRNQVVRTNNNYLLLLLA